MNIRFIKRQLSPLVSGVVFIFVITIGSCSTSSMLTVDYQSEDSTKFQVKPISLISENTNAKGFKVLFAYKHNSNRRANVTCQLKVINELERMAFTGVSITTEGVEYHASTFDYPPSKLKGKDQFIHTITLFVPELDFQKMTESNSIVIELDGIKYKVEEKKWVKASSEINERGLIN